MHPLGKASLAFLSLICGDTHVYAYIQSSFLLDWIYNFMHFPLFLHFEKKGTKNSASGQT